jgi:hypothetical protein
VGLSMANNEIKQADDKAIEVKESSLYAKILEKRRNNKSQKNDKEIDKDHIYLSLGRIVQHIGAVKLFSRKLEYKPRENFELEIDHEEIYLNISAACDQSHSAFLSVISEVRGYFSAPKDTKNIIRNIQPEINGFNIENIIDSMLSIKRYYEYILENLPINNYVTRYTASKKCRKAINYH